MGNIFYVLITENDPFEEIADEKGDSFIKDLVKKGIRPKLNDEILKSSDPSVRAMVHAMGLCHAYDRKSRPLASTIRDYLQNATTNILKDRDEELVGIEVNTPITH